jgi:hypothetical protein
MAYTSAETAETNTNDKASTANYNANSVIGDAIKETSTAGTGPTSWYSDCSYFAGHGNLFFLRGGGRSDGSIAGVFSFSRTNGVSDYHFGFRAVLVAQ